MSPNQFDVGRALKSIGDAYIESHPADLPSVRAGVDGYRRRSWFVWGGAALVTGAAALVFFFAMSDSPDETLPPAGERLLDIVQEVRLEGSPLQIAAKQDVAWVTRYNDGLVSRIEVGAEDPSWERDVGTVPADILATGDGLWIADRDDNRIVQLDPDTGEEIGIWDLDQPPARIAVGERAIRATVDGVGVVRIDRTTREQETIYPGNVIDIAMGETAFWVLTAEGRIVPIDPDTGDPVVGLEIPEVAGDGEVTFLRDALYYGVGGNPTLQRFDESTGQDAGRILLPAPYQDIDADAEGLWVLVREGRLGALLELDPTTGEPTDVSLQLEDDPVDIVTGDDGVWVALSSGGRVVRVTD